MRKSYLKKIPKVWCGSIISEFENYEHQKLLKHVNFIDITTITYLIMIDIFRIYTSFMSFERILVGEMALVSFSVAVKLC